MKVWFTPIAALCALAASAAAIAGDTVKIGVEGRITPSCTLTGGAASDTRVMTIPDLKTGNFQYGYGIQCNAPFKYSIVSDNGALALEGQMAGRNRPEARLPYLLTVNIPTDDVVINDQCPSDTLKTGRVTCPFRDSGQGIALSGQATLTLTWAPPVAPLPAGTYSDRLTFSVGVKQ